MQLKVEMQFKMGPYSITICHAAQQSTYTLPFKRLLSITLSKMYIYNCQGVGDRGRILQHRGTESQRMMRALVHRTRARKKQSIDKQGTEK